MPKVYVRRGTRAQLDAAATAGQLAAGEVYLITNEQRLAVGLSAGSYQAAAKSGEPGQNSGMVPWLRRLSAPRIVGEVSGGALATLALVGSRLCYIPFIVPRAVTLAGLRISITTAVAGTASVGIYENTLVSDNDSPGALLASATGIDTGTDGNKDGALSLALVPGILYWACLICSVAATVRAIPAATMQPAIGRIADGGSAGSIISYLHTPGSGATLPDPAPTSFTVAGGATPAIYLLEA